MAASTDVGLAFLEGGAVLAVSVVTRGYCARNLTLEMVPAVLRTRIQLCNRLAPLMLLIAVAMVVIGAWLSVTAS
jgi:hypothetical protein